MNEEYSPFRAGGLATGNYNRGQSESERLFMRALMNRLGRKPTSQELYKAAPGAEKITLGNWMHASPNLDTTPASLRSFSYGGQSFSPDAEGGIGPTMAKVFAPEFTTGTGGSDAVLNRRLGVLKNDAERRKDGLGDTPIADPLERYRMDRLRAAIGRPGGKKTWR